MACDFCDSPVPSGARYCPTCGVALACRVDSGRDDPKDVVLVGARDDPPPPPASAMASLVFGILAWTVLPILGAVAAVVAGHMARHDLRGQVRHGRSFDQATVGLVLGYLQLAPLLLVTALVIGLVAVGGVATLAFWL